MRQRTQPTTHANTLAHTHTHTNVFAFPILSHPNGDEDNKALMQQLITTMETPRCVAGGVSLTVPNLTVGMPCSCQLEGQASEMGSTSQHIPETQRLAWR